MAKLIGAPPGYVGFEDGNLGGGLLISDIERNPHSIILMDEIEKAKVPKLMIIMKIVNNFPASLNSYTSLNPTVAVVITVM